MLDYNIKSQDKAVLLLEDGTTYWGKAVGKRGKTTGELCFNTGMTGYQEIYTDPSYYNQIIVNTMVHIGNYGINKNEVESSSMKIAGMVCKDFCVKHSRKNADDTLESSFLAEDLVAISDVDTRSIVKHIRDKGAMNAIISSDEFDLKILAQLIKNTPSMQGLELSSKVSTQEAYTLGSDEEYSFKIAVLDYGVKKSILNHFVTRNAYVKIFPMKTPIDDLLAWNPDGFFLSNGPGDPAAMPFANDFITELLATKKPIFGICLGHQLLAQALGIKTYKMHNGHRGLNHPVLNVLTGKCEITSQNHGFSISKESVLEHSDKVEITHINLNDDTVEGIRHKSYPAFSVQYHPEAGPGPHDSSYLFDQFFQMLASQRIN
ncbi:MAG: glutamine-hydrolyzing carbamoyl-phosphate synthase small subunit [Saprospiraceae bacterium]|nr:glutamine-hydrolyzing carbamoyl-phosphate synthase small subunit [Saprospiraceae bacterium]